LLALLNVETGLDHKPGVGIEEFVMLCHGCPFTLEGWRNPRARSMVMTPQTPDC
jgi:hypothetical protein